MKLFKKVNTLPKRALFMHIATHRDFTIGIFLRAFYTPNFDYGVAIGSANRSQKKNTIIIVLDVTYNLSYVFVRYIKHT
jgi:hypothetical protein